MNSNNRIDSAIPADFFAAFSSVSIKFDSNQISAKTRLLAAAMVDVRSHPSSDRPWKRPSSKYCLIAASGLSRYMGIRSGFVAI